MVRLNAVAAGLVRLASVGLLSTGLVSIGLLAACGGSTPEATTPDSDPGTDDPLLEDEPEGVAPASSPSVQQGIDAIQAGEFAEAKAALEKAVKDAPDDPQAAFYLGVAQASLGETDAALTQMRRALELKPDFTEASINFSALLLDAGKAEEAVAAADEGLKHAPDDSSLLQNKGLALFDLGRQPEAASILEKAVAKAPDNEELRFAYAQSLMASDQEQKAMVQLEKLNQSSSVEVLASIADLFGRAAAWEQCIGALDRAIEQQPAAELQVKRGLCKHGKQDEDGAKADFEAAIQTDPKSPKGHFYLGQNLKARGANKEAKAAFKKAAELDPDGKLGQAAKKAAASM